LFIPSYFEVRGTQVQKDVIHWLHTDLKPDYLCDNYICLEFPENHPLYPQTVADFVYWERQFGFDKNNNAKGIVVVRLQ